MVSWVRAHAWASIVGVTAVVFAVVGVFAYARATAEPRGCLPGQPAGLGADSVDSPNQTEDPKMVVADVDAVAQLTVLEDLNPAGDKDCKNSTRPRHQVRARVDAVLYSKTASSSSLKVGDVIEVTVTNARVGLSAAPGSIPDFRVAIAALYADALDPTTKQRVPWLVDGPARLIPPDWPDRKKWDQAIAEVSNSPGG